MTDDQLMASFLSKYKRSLVSGQMLAMIVFRVDGKADEGIRTG